MIEERREVFQPEKPTLLEPGRNMTLRPMRYPVFYEMYKAAIRNTWGVPEVDFKQDIPDLQKMTQAEGHLITRLVAFFATGDSIVEDNLLFNLYRHIKSPEARMFVARQGNEEALHIDFYLTLLDTYVPDLSERQQAFAAVENIPSIKKKADFSFKWMDSVEKMEVIQTDQDKKDFLNNLTAFTACNEGLFFFAAFAYVYFLRSKGLLRGLAEGTNWVFRDESLHIAFGFQAINALRQEYPHLFDTEYENCVKQMIQEALECEMNFADDLLSGGVAGLSIRDMSQYLQYVANQRLRDLRVPPQYPVTRNPFDFMNLQDAQELTNFFERRVAAYQTGITGNVSLDEDF